jgi:uncharacterized membrane protein YbhN (UPF0104 family)
MWTGIKQAFSENDGTVSSARLLTALCTLASLVWISYIVYHTCALPDAVTLGGTTAFSVAHYAANKLTGGPKNN